MRKLCALSVLIAGIACTSESGTIDSGVGDASIGDGRIDIGSGDAPAQDSQVDTQERDSTRDVETLDSATLDSSSDAAIDGTTNSDVSGEDTAVIDAAADASLSCGSAPDCVCPSPDVSCDGRRRCISAVRCDSPLDRCPSGYMCNGTGECVGTGVRGCLCDAHCGASQECDLSTQTCRLGRVRIGGSTCPPGTALPYRHIGYRFMNDYFFQDVDHACRPLTGTLALGETCTRSEDCAHPRGFCLMRADGPMGVCAALCHANRDCPSGMGCEVPGADLNVAVDPELGVCRTDSCSCPGDDQLCIDHDDGTCATGAAVCDTTADCAAGVCSAQGPYSTDLRCQRSAADCAGHEIEIPVRRVVLGRPTTSNMCALAIGTWDACPDGYSPYEVTQVWRAGWKPAVTIGPAVMGTVCAR